MDTFSFLEGEGCFSALFQNIEFLHWVNSIKKYKCTLQVGPLFLQIHTNLNPLKVFTSSR